MKNQNPHFSIGRDYQVFFRNPNQVHPKVLATSFHPLPFHVTTAVVGQWSPLLPIALSPSLWRIEPIYRTYRCLVTVSPTHPTYPPLEGAPGWRWWFGWAEEADGGGKGMTGLNDRIVEGSWRDRLERRVGGARAPRRKWAGATPDRRRPSHTILEAIPPPRQSTVGIRIVNNP